MFDVVFDEETDVEVLRVPYEEIICVTLRLRYMKARRNRSFSLSLSETMKEIKRFFGERSLELGLFFRLPVLPLFLGGGFWTS